MNGAERKDRADLEQLVKQLEHLSVENRAALPARGRPGGLHDSRRPHAELQVGWRFRHRVLDHRRAAALPGR